MITGVFLSSFIRNFAMHHASKKNLKWGLFWQIFFVLLFMGNNFFVVDVIGLEKPNKCISDTNLFLNYCLKYDVSLNISISHRDINVLSQHFNVMIK